MDSFRAVAEIAGELKVLKPQPSADRGMGPNLNVRRLLRSTVCCTVFMVRLLCPKTHFDYLMAENVVLGGDSITHEELAVLSGLSAE